MDKKEFLNLSNIQQKRISDKYGAFMYFMISNIFNINYITSKIEEEIGYTTKRDIFNYTVYDEIYYKNKLIGRIECVGSFPKIVFEKRCRLHAKKFMKYAIEPIKGIHVILEWHDAKEKKLQCLAGGQTVLHFSPLNITNNEIDNFIKEMKLEPLVEHLNTIK